MRLYDWREPLATSSMPGCPAVAAQAEARQNCTPLVGIEWGVSAQIEVDRHARRLERLGQRFFEHSIAVRPQQDENVIRLMATLVDEVPTQACYGVGFFILIIEAKESNFAITCAGSRT